MVLAALAWADPANPMIWSAPDPPWHADDPGPNQRSLDEVVNPRVRLAGTWATIDRPQDLSSCDIDMSVRCSAVPSACISIRVYWVRSSSNMNSTNASMDANSGATVWWERAMSSLHGSPLDFRT